MVVPYGFGVGDVIAVGTIAWNVYKSCRAAPESFSNISLEVLSLHAVLKEAEETVFKSPLPTESQKRLTTVGDGCRGVLDDLQKLVDRYESLGTQNKRTWDRMKWGAQDIAEIRQRLISNTTMLTAFISWFTNAVESGAFHEEEPPSLPESTCSSGTHSLVISSSSFEIDELDTPDVSGGIGPLDPAENQHKDIEPAASKQTAAASNSTRHISRIAILIAILSRPKKRFSAAVRAGDPLEVKGFLEHPASRHALNDHTLYTELGNAVRFNYQSLIKPMIEAGAPVNPINTKAGHNELSPLMIAVQRGDQSIVRCLLENGADVNHNAKAGAGTPNALRCAISIKSESMVSLLLAYGADVNAKRRSRDDCVAIHQALEIGFMPIVGLLLEHGAYIDTICRYHGNLMMIAIDTRNVQALRYLVDKGADVNKMTCTVGTARLSCPYPLARATSKGSLEMVRILVENGAVDGLQYAQRYARYTTGLLNRIEIMRLLDQQMSRLQDDRTAPAGNRS